MIRLTCPGCGSNLNAKEELLGQTRKCPKCGAEILITAPTAEAESVVQDSTGLDEAPAGLTVSPREEDPVHRFRGPERLERVNQYIICDSSKVVAAWQNDGRGWMLHAATGLISAARNNDKIPTSGNFQLVELQMGTLDDSPRLEGLLVYRLGGRWALMNLNKGDDAVLTAVNAAGALNRDQKIAVRRYLREHLMRHVWENAEAVLEYLGNIDYHSPGVPATGPSELPTASDGGEEPA